MAVAQLVANEQRELAEILRDTFYLLDLDREVRYFLAYRAGRTRG